MTMQYDVRSANLGLNESVNGPNRLKGMMISYTTGAVIEITDGVGTSNKFEWVSPAAAGSMYVLVPGEGIRFNTSIYIKTLTNATINVFYG